MQTADDKLKLPTNKTLEMAIQYVNSGYKVLPCCPNGKRPDGDLVPHSFYDASDDEEIVIEWWTQKPNANLALSTEGLIVVDVDMINRSEGIENPWPPHVSKELMQGAVAKSPSGGTHYFFKKPAGLEIGISAGKVAKGVDIRTDGGIILVEPSTVKDKPYKWFQGFELEGDLPEPPDWLIDELKKRSSLPVDLGGEGNRIPYGHQHDTLFRFACAMRRNGASSSEINAALQVVNQERCEKPGTYEAVERIARDAGKYEPDQFSVAVLENHFGQDFGDNGEFRGGDFEDPGAFPKEFLEAPGFIGNVMKYPLR